MLFAEKNKVRLDGKVVAITGANTGIGKETALELCKRGAKVLMLCRSMEKANLAKEEIVKETGGVVDIYQMDLSSLKSIRECCERIVENEDKIDILINNAGVMFCPHWKTLDGFDMQFGTNHLGHFLLTELLRPLIKQAATSVYRPRIVIVSSALHTKGTMAWEDLNWKTRSYSRTGAYSQSKLANVLHAKELARRVEGDNISVYSLHPGVINTELSRHAYETWWGKVIGPVARVATKAILLTPKQGAQTTLYCCLEESISNDSGKYYSSCKEKEPVSAANDVNQQRKLWAISEKLVGLTD